MRVLFIVIFMPSELCFTIYSLLFFNEVIEIGKLDTLIDDDVGLLLFVLPLPLPPPPDVEGATVLSLPMTLLAIEASSLELLVPPMLCGAPVTVGVFGGDSSLT